KMLSSYARHALREVQELHPEWTVRSCKVYRVEHRILIPKDFGEIKDPDTGETQPGLHFDDAVLFLPYYQGQYDPDGKLMDPADPLLYWLVPIIDEREKGPAADKGLGVFRGPVPIAVERPRGYVLKNYVKKHAGDRGATTNLPPLRGEWP